MLYFRPQRINFIVPNPRIDNTIFNRFISILLNLFHIDAQTKWLPLCRQHFLKATLYSVECIPMGLIDIKPALVHVIAWDQLMTCHYLNPWWTNEPLFEPMMNQWTNEPLFEPMMNQWTIIWTHYEPMNQWTIIWTHDEPMNHYLNPWWTNESMNHYLNPWWTNEPLFEPMMNQWTIIWTHDEPMNHYLNQWWPDLLIHFCITRPWWANWSQLQIVFVKIMGWYTADDKPESKTKMTCRWPWIFCKKDILGHSDNWAWYCIMMDKICNSGPSAKEVMSLFALSHQYVY